MGVTLVIVHDKRSMDFNFSSGKTFSKSNFQFERISPKYAELNLKGTYLKRNKGEFLGTIGTVFNHHTGNDQTN